MTETTRRAVMFGAGGAGLAAVLTACASYGSPVAEPAPDTADLAEEPDADELDAEESAAPKKKKPKALADTADIGEGKIFKNQDVVITQPSEGDFRAFSATCTHQGCAVASVSNGVINCPCHGSQFSAEDGSVVQGPASEPLAQKKINVSGGKIRLA